MGWGVIVMFRNEGIFVAVIATPPPPPRATSNFAFERRIERGGNEEEDEESQLRALRSITTYRRGGSQLSKALSVLKLCWS